MPSAIRLIDRTRTVQDWKCRRSRYLGYELGGRGIVKKGTSLELFMGITLHDALAAIATYHSSGSVDIDAIASAARQQMFDNLMEDPGDTLMNEALEFANEQASLVEGLVRGFYRHAWPRLLDGYRVVQIEGENEFKLDEEGLYVFMTKPDLLLESTTDDSLIYIEYKSTSSKKDKWISSWDTAVQLHSSIKAVEATQGRKPDFVRIVGLYKGYESYGKQSSPFCYAYKKSGNPPFTQDQIQYDYKAGFRRSPTWEMAGGVKTWVEGMPDNVLADQFPMTAPIMVNDALVDKFFKQRLYREIEIANAIPFIDDEAILDQVFPQSFDQCVPSFGYSCPYRKICHGEVTDPLNEGYEWRTPHHERETELFSTE